MSQVMQPKVGLSSAPPRRTVVLGVALATAALAAIVLVLALTGASSDNATPVGAQAQPGLRADGGPEETDIAAAVGSPRAVAPDESRVAAAIGGVSQSSSHPDESRTAAAVAGR